MTTRKRDPVELVPGPEEILPIETVMVLLGHTSLGSTRKEMSRRGIPARHGWRTEDVNEVLVQRTGWNLENTLAAKREEAAKAARRRK